MEDVRNADGPLAFETPRPPATQRIVSWLGWTAFGLFCFLCFTVVKVPQIRLKRYIQGQISAVLAARDIKFAAEEASLGIGIGGLTYTMKRVTLTPAPPATPVRIDHIEVSPALIATVMGSIKGGPLMSGDVRIQQSSGYLSSSASARMKDGQNEISFTFKARELDLGKLGVFSLGAGLQGSAMASGSGSLSGDLANPSTLVGNIELELAKVTTEPQKLMGFDLPRLVMSEARADVKIEGGRAQIKVLKLGRTGTADDVIGNVSGDILLGRQMEASTLNIKTRFSLSQNLTRAVPVDLLLSAGKKPDGSFAFLVSGPLTFPTSTPDTNP